MSTQNTNRPPYLDLAYRPEARAEDLVSRMTLDEKCSQVTYDAPAIERLGVEAHNWWNECLHGVGRAGTATVFPQAIALAATFNTDLMHRVATAIADEARAKHHALSAKGDRGIYKGLTFWSPNINIFRDPRWGRGHETYGECPFLTARMGVAFVTGLQGKDPRYLKLVATPKHFAVHSGPEHGRHGFDARVSQQDLYETYLPAFRATIQEAGAFSVMGAYNRINGEPCCASSAILDRILREDWGFSGYTVSDCGAIYDLHAHHKLTNSAAESSALAIKNGLDLCCGEDYKSLREAVRLGLVDEATIHRAAVRLMTARIKLGMFDEPSRVPFTQISYDVVDCDAHRARSLEAARASIVLLKNADEVLPLSPTLKSIAVIGPNADARSILLGNYHGTPSYTISPIDGIRAAVSDVTRVTLATGTTHLASEGAWLGMKTRGFAEAVIAAERADVVVLCLGLTPTIEGEEGDAMNSDAGGDRTAIELPAIQQQLLEAVCATGKPVVLALIAGSAIAIPWAAEHVPAIVQQFYPGQDGGTALADVLFGKHNPSGRLPVTVYRATADLPPFTDYAMDRRTYRFFDREALFPFGFGLGYSQFIHDEFDERNFSVRVSNNGKMEGTEIVQAYVRLLDAPVRTPRWQLAAIQPVQIRAGESVRVKLALSEDALTFVDAEGRRVKHTGEYELAVGGSQPDPRGLALGAAEPVRIRLSTRA